MIGLLHLAFRVACSLFLLAVLLALSQSSVIF